MKTVSLPRICLIRDFCPGWHTIPSQTDRPKSMITTMADHSQGQHVGDLRSSVGIKARITSVDQGLTKKRFLSF